MYHKILLISLAGIGDSMLFGPALKLLAKNFPDAEIHSMVMFKSGIDYFSRFGEIKKIHYSDFLHNSAIEKLKFLWKLRKEKFDLIINTYPSNRAGYNAVAKFLCFRTAGHRYLNYNSKNLYFLNSIVVQEQLNRHPVEENIALVRAMGAEGEAEKRLLFPILADETTEAEKWMRIHNLQGKVLIGFHPGSSTFKNHIHKRWSADKFGQLGKYLTEKYHAKILVFGGPEESMLMESITKIIGEKALAVTGTKLGVTSAILKTCRLMVSNDTSLMHIAAALRVTTVAIFGPTDVRKGRPFHAPHVIASTYLTCSPCFYYSAKPLHCKWKTFECLRDLGVEEVAEKCVEMLTV
jgi:heptosyltransferase-2